jgi:hypothetical protein
MLTKELLIELQEYVENYLSIPTFEVCESMKYSENMILPDVEQFELENFIKNNLKPTLNELMFRFIDRKGMSDPELYKKAGIDRKLFSKIRSNPKYRPGKNTIISLALALELDRDESDEFLSTAGYSLSESETFDLIIQFFLEKRIYDIDQVNQALDYFSLKPLSGVLK